MKRTSIGAVFILLVSSVVSSAQGFDAKTVFRKNCAICHGVEGRADTPMAKNLKVPDLTSPAVQQLTDGQIRATIDKGTGPMPPFGPALGEAGLNAMVKYVRGLKSK